MSKTAELLSANIAFTNSLLIENFQLKDQIESMTKEIELLKAKLAKAEANATSLGWEASNSRDEASFRGRDGWMTD